MNILGIETSCDDTSLCVMKDHKILSLQTFSQVSHEKYGGVVPEIAARDHLLKIKLLANDCLDSAGVSVEEIDLIACTNRPGLIGSLLVGVMFAKGLSVAYKKNLLFVDHLEGHIFTANITHGISENFYCLLVSGGHTQVMKVKNIDNYSLIGRSIDDSIGEAFDKLAKFLNLGYPGGPIVEKYAKSGNSQAFKFETPMKSYDKLNFSLSGLKTFFLRIIKANDLTQSFIQDVCASFQRIICQIIEDRLRNVFKEKDPEIKHFVLCGGVASNQYIRLHIQKLCEEYGMTFIAPEPKLCTDNAAMIANVGFLRSK